MNLHLEDRLQAHLGTDASHHASDDGLLMVKKRARRRSLQTRIAAGALGLAALAGLGSLVPTGETTDALITATEPTPETTEPAPTPEPEPQAEAPRPQAAPNGYNVVADGHGGFVAPRFLGAAQNIRFVRSTDGETWFAAEEPELPEGFAAMGFRFESDFFVLSLDRDGNGSYPNEWPHLAISEDLLTWEIIDLGLRSPADDGPLATGYSIGEIAVNGDDLAVAVLETNDINYSYFEITERNVCTLVLAPEAGTLGLCDGTLLTEETDLRPGVVQHVLVSRSGAAATELRDFETTESPFWDWTWRPTIPLPQDDSFAVAAYETDPATLVSALTASKLADLGDPQLVAVKSAAGQRLLIVDTTSGLHSVLTSTTNGVVEDTIALLPGDIGPISARDGYRIAHGAAGWTLTVNDFDTVLVEVERNGWQLIGDRRWAGAQLRSLNHSEQVFFDVAFTTLPPGVRMGLFGGIRYFHPVTGELLIELTREEAISSAVQAVDISEMVFDRSVEVDGWTISGHPLLGPLTLTSPSGVVTEYADGFAFDNDDITDGVETDIGANAFGDFALQRADIIRFFDDDGVEVVSVRGRELFRDLVTPVLADADPAGDLVLDAVPSTFKQDAFIVHTEDGSDWEVIWSPMIGEDNQPGVVVNVAVGDNEILVALPNESVRIPIDD